MEAESVAVTADETVAGTEGETAPRADTAPSTAVSDDSLDALADAAPGAEAVPSSPGPVAKRARSVPGTDDKPSDDKKDAEYECDSEVAAATASVAGTEGVAEDAFEG